MNGACGTRLHPPSFARFGHPSREDGRLRWPCPLAIGRLPNGHPGNRAILGTPPEDPPKGTAMTDAPSFTRRPTYGTPSEAETAAHEAIHAVDADSMDRGTAYAIADAAERAPVGGHNRAARIKRAAD